MQGHILEEWRIQSIEQKADQASRRLYELDSLRGDVGSLECANRELRSKIDELRSQLQALQESVQTMNLPM